MSLSTITLEVKPGIGPGGLLPASQFGGEGGLLGGVHPVSLLFVQLGEVAVGGRATRVQRQASQVSFDGLARIAFDRPGTAEFEVDISLKLLVKK